MDFLSTKQLLSTKDALRFSDITFDSYLKSFTQHIMSIYAPHSELETNEYLQEIIKIPWIFCQLYTSQKEQEYSWAASTYNVFAITCERLFEFTLNILLTNEECLNDFYLSFDHTRYNDLIDFYMKQVLLIENRGFKIDKFKSKNEVNYIDSVCNITIVYKPRRNVQPFKKLLNPLKQFLRFSEYTERIYNYDDSNNLAYIRNPKGQWGKREHYETDETDFTGALIKKNRQYISVEEMVEDAGKSNLCSSPVLNDISERILGFKPASENSQFKRVKIARAISANIAKQNQNLCSDYKIPDRRIFCDFLNKQIIGEKMGWQQNLFLLSLLLAVPYKKLLKYMHGMDESIKINLQQGTFTIQLDASIFAKNSKNITQYTRILKGTQQIKTHLPRNIIRLLHHLDHQIIDNLTKSPLVHKEINRVFKAFEIEKVSNFHYKGISTFKFKKSIEAYLAENIATAPHEIINKLSELSFLDYYFEDMGQQFHNFIKKRVSDYPKRIILHPNKLPDIHQRYLDEQHNESSTERLFFLQVNKSQQVKMCYTAMPSIYALQKNWYMMLQKYLKIDQRLNMLLECQDETDPENKSMNNVVGSPFYILPGKSKNFFLSLLNAINIPGLDDPTRDSIKMIYIRYAFSFLFGTRDFHHSCDLYEYSRTYSIITIHEKAKDARSSKRIIPVCNTAKKLIEVFFEIKDKYDSPHYTPFLISKQENSTLFETITQKNLLAWLHEKELNIDTSFIKYIPQNYGRHVIKSSKLSSNIKDENIDAFLNHHSAGTEDQGKFSTFSNKKYMDEMKIFLESIAEEYLPRYGTENLQ